MRIWQKYTCVQFRHKRHNDKKWVRIQYGGCYSMVGMAAPAQPLVLGPNCDKIRSILHELGHCMGLNHEHSRPDRDHYITVYRHRINSYHNFEKISRDKAFTFGIPYDYYSIMHYHSRKSSEVVGVQEVVGIQELVGVLSAHYDFHVISYGSLKLGQIKKMTRCQKSDSDSPVAILESIPKISTGTQSNLGAFPDLSLRNARFTSSMEGLSFNVLHYISLWSVVYVHIHYRQILEKICKNFANSYEDNIVTKDKRMMSVIGRYENLSFYNYKLVYMMYNCGAKCPKKRCPGEGFPAKNCICYCKTNTPKDPIRKCSETECRDLIFTCRLHAKNNGCTRMYHHMSKSCRKTCGICPGSNIHHRKENIFLTRISFPVFRDKSQRYHIYKNKSVKCRILPSLCQFAKGENHLMRNLGEQVADKCGCKETEMIVNEGEGINE
ncbi:uncharacterized protein LOC115209455 [Octopus sinensis]|uniref:Metalloendopeptidase n=1 Tax=Octopus sinensis TaxID=2607531 RepID=A0A7E6EPF7_9MOLL|nr:uncharacterized protein LOC115209455 [Octopus sinensis]